MPAGGLVIAGAGSLASGVIGGIQSSANRAAAQQAEQNALMNYLNVNVPDPEQQRIILQRYQQTGTIDPQIVRSMQQQQTELNNVSVDPTSREAEINALTEMQNISANGGMDAQAKQQQQQAINTANANEAGQQGAIVQNFAQRGMGGSGVQLAAQLSADQGTANTSAQAGLNSAASAEQRALQAMMASSQMGSNLNSQDYQQAANRANAQDAINKFNTQNSQNVENNNTNILNNAQAENTKNAQTLANQNVDIGNKQETYNQGLYQQKFNNEMAKASGEANAENGVANQYNNQATATANQWGGIGNAIAQGGTAYATYKAKNSGDDTDSSDSEE